MPYMTVTSAFGLGVEATRGGSASVVASMPITSPQTTPTPKYILDQGYRGSPVDSYDEVVGVQYDAFDAKGFAYLDTFGHLLRGILGGTDVVVGSVAPYIHTIPLLTASTAASVGYQPPSYTLVDFDGHAANQLVGSQMASLALTAKTDGALEWTGKWICNPVASIATPSQTFSTSVFVPAWDFAASIGGASVNTLEEFDITIDRSTKSNFTNGSRAPKNNFAGPCKVTGKLTAEIDTAGYFDVMANGLTRAHEAVVLLFTEPVSGNTLQLTMSAVQFEQPKVDRGSTLVKIGASFTALANATDAVGGGYSPIKPVLTNSQSALY